MPIVTLWLTRQQRGRFGVFLLQRLYCVQAAFISRTGNWGFSLAWCRGSIDDIPDESETSTIWIHMERCGRRFRACGLNCVDSQVVLDEA